jgi:hypothetical protein
MFPSSSKILEMALTLSKGILLCLTPQFQCSMMIFWSKVLVLRQERSWQQYKVSKLGGRHEKQNVLQRKSRVHCLIKTSFIIVDATEQVLDPIRQERAVLLSA